jgi:alkaline phosphatase
LIGDWKSEKDQLSPGRNVVALNKEDLDGVDPDETDYLFGVFSPTHMSYSDERASTDQPSLKEMAGKAVQILKKNQVQ